MKTSSPMLERVKKGYHRTNPLKSKKKNLFFLVFLFSALISAVCWNFPKDKNNPLSENSSGLETGNDIKRSILKKGRSKTKDISLNSFSSNSLKNHFEIRPPDLSRQSEKITLNNKEYIFHYSIDSSLQQYAAKLLKRYKPKYGAVVASNPSTGQILALYSYSNDSSPFIDSMLCLKSIFPAASIFKIITASAAIEKKGLDPKSKIITAGRNHTLYKYQLKMQPDNYRMITLENAFAYSINPAFGHMGLHLLKADILKEYGANFGFNTEIPFILNTEKPRLVISDTGFAVAELSSGFNRKTEISPLFGVLIASAIANRGTLKKPVLIDSVISLDNNKKIFEESRGIWRKPVKASTAEKVCDLMNAVAHYGTARSSFRYIKKSFRFDKITYGGKTGSLDKDGLGKIDWFIGFASHREDKNQQIAVSVVTVHGPKWTVHSSYIGAEIIRKRIRNIQSTQYTENKTDSSNTNINKGEI